MHLNRHLRVAPGRRGSALRIAVGIVWLAGTTAAYAQPSTSTRSASFNQRFEKFVEGMRRDPSAPPGFAIVVVENSNTIFERAYGTRDLRMNDPLTLDAPIYTASTTKSFVGLLAAQLDAAGILPLGATMRDVWPAISLPAPLDPSRVTARSFLSHVSGIESPVLGWRYSDTGEYRSEEVPALLSQYATVANRAFDYGNIGPVIYTAMAETRLRMSWRDALQKYVVQPLKLTRMSARLEDFAPAEIAQCHARWGGRWTVAPQKPTVLLDAGGGVLASARDAGTYLKAFTSDGKSTGGAISAAVLRETYRKAATQDREFFGFHRTGYGLGWDLSDYGAHKIVSRSGGYPGCRSIMIFLPEERFGILVFSLGDAGANLFGTTLVQQAVDYWTNDPASDARATQRLANFTASAAKSIREADTVSTIPEDRGAGALPEYAGSYESAGRGRVAVSMHPDGMEAAAGALRLLLAPKEKDQFDAYDATVPGQPLPFKFRRDPTGAVDAFVFREVTFLKKTGPVAEQIDATVKRLMLRERVQGFALAFVDRGKVAHVAAYGRRNVQRNLPLTRTTIMYGASLTKTAVAYMVMQLVDQGRLDLDKSIDKLLPRPLPEYEDYGDLRGDERWRLLTLRMILNHTTGFANFRWLEPDKRLQFHHAPGSRYGYSGEGFYILQLVLEKGLGLDVGKEMQTRVFDRFGMSNTSMMWRPALAANLADGYAADGTMEPHDERGSVSAAGSMDTSIDDQARLWAGIVRGDGLSAKSRAELVRPQTPITSAHQFPTLAPGNSAPHADIRLSAGLGVVTFVDASGPAWFKGGHNDWTGNMVLCLENGQRCVIMLANDVRAERIFPEVARLLLGETRMPWTWEYDWIGR